MRRGQRVSHNILRTHSYKIDDKRLDDGWFSPGENPGWKSNSSNLHTILFVIRRARTLLRLCKQITVYIHNDKINGN